MILIPIPIRKSVQKWDFTREEFEKPEA